MKKITLLASMLFALAVNAQNVIYQEDFESYTVGDNVGEDTDIPPTFLSYDVDGDGFNWGLSNPRNFYQDMEMIYPNNFIMSASYITEGDQGNGNQGAVHANNILVLPMISIPQEAAGVKFGYYVGGGTSGNFFSETYYITVTNSSDEATILAATPIVTETLPTNLGRTREVSLEDYIGQDIYIAFRHQTFDQWMLGLDNLKVEAATLATVENAFQDFSYFIDRNNQLLLSSNTPMSSVKMYNLLGQEVISEKFSQTQKSIDMAKLSDGIFIVKVTVNQQETTFKILKN